MENREKIREVGIIKKSGLIKIEPVSDARISELNMALGINRERVSILDYVTTDIDEIMSRQEVTRWLMLPGMNEFARGLSKRSSIITFPDEDRDLIEYYRALKEDRTNFWLRVAAFMDGIGFTADYERPTLPPRVKELFDEIDLNSRFFRRKEDNLAEKIITSLRSMVAIEGLLTFKIDTYNWKHGGSVISSKDTEDNFCFGIRKYDPSLDGVYEEIKFPKWTRKPGEIAAKFINDILRDRRRSPARISRTPDAVKMDITAFIEELFKKNRDIVDDEVASFEVNVAYQLDASGLNVQILNWNIKMKIKGTCFEEQPSSVAHPDFVNDNNHRKVKKYAEKVSKARTALVADRRYLKMAEWLAGLSKNMVRIKSPLTAREFCLSHFKTVYSSYQEQIREITEWQAKIEKAFDDIIFLSGIIERMCLTGSPGTLPEFAADGVFEFKDIYPIRLFSVKQKILPFNLFSVNGSVVNLTGRNGSGKTTLQITLLDAMLMAMSGLPVPAMEARMPAVNTILLSFLDREIDRSTYQAKMDKDTNNARIVSKMPLDEKQHAILIIDEHGSATTQDSVLALAEDYIKWMNGQGVSVVMSTQIPELSRFIESEIGGINLIIKKKEEDDAYELFKGIGEGEPMILAQKSGLLEIIGFKE